MLINAWAMLINAWANKSTTAKIYAIIRVYARIKAKNPTAFHFLLRPGQRGFCRDSRDSRVWQTTQGNVDFAAIRSLPKATWILPRFPRFPRFTDHPGNADFAAIPEIPEIRRPPRQRGFCRDSQPTQATRILPRFPRFLRFADHPGNADFAAIPGIPAFGSPPKQRGFCRDSQDSRDCRDP
jgi:hypothetical protein